MLSEIEMQISLKCAGGDIDGLKKLIDKDPNLIKQVFTNGFTMLHIACIQGNALIVDMLIANGVDVNQVNSSGETPLYALSDGNYGHIEIIKRLIDNGADVNKANTDTDGETPLHVACCYGQIEIVKLLIANGADVNKADTNGETPLYYAYNTKESDRIEIVNLLIDNGADINEVTNISGETPLFRAFNCGYIEIAKLLIQATLLKELNKEKPDFIEKHAELSDYFDKKVIAINLSVHLRNEGITEGSIQNILYKVKDNFDKKARSEPLNLLTASAKSLPFFSTSARVETSKIETSNPRLGS